MGGRRGPGAALAASLLGHGALLAAAVAIGLLGAPPGPPESEPIPVRRAADPAPEASPRLALSGAEGSDPGQADTVVALDTSDPRYRPYLSAVRRRIWERWSMPEVSEDRAVRGSLVVEFTLTRSGRLAASGVLEPSGTPALDRAALEAVARAVPFTPLPESIAGDSLRVRARFTYD